MKSFPIIFNFVALTSMILKMLQYLMQLLFLSFSWKYHKHLCFYLWQIWVHKCYWCKYWQESLRFAMEYEAQLFKHMSNWFWWENWDYQGDFIASQCWRCWFYHQEYQPQCFFYQYHKKTYPNIYEEQTRQ